MPTLPKIEAEMNVTTNMKQIMAVMKGIAMSSFVEIKKKRENRFEKFVKSFDRFFQLADMTRAVSPFVQAECPTIGVIAITSNESFMAGLNNKIIKMGLDKTQDSPKHFVITGPRMLGRLRSEGVDYTIFPGFREKNMYEVAVQIKDFVIGKVREKEMGKVIAVFADPVSLSSQEIRAVNMLPAHDIYPQAMNNEVDPSELMCQESAIDPMMELLAELWITHKLIEMFQDNKMSEFAAQAMTLDGSLENLKELEKKLKLTFVKTRREVIDASLRETISSMMVAGK